MHAQFSALSSRARFITIMATLVLCAMPLSPVRAASDQEPGVIGKWRLMKALDAAEISALDDREAQQLIGRVFTVSKRTVKVGKRDDCLPPSFETKIVEPNWYVREWAHASADLLGLPNPVTVVDLGCTNAFIKNRQRIVVFWKGWFFDAQRVR